MASKRIPFIGVSTDGVDPQFLSSVVDAVVAQGATMIRVFSGRRTRANNTGVKNSNHLYGHALDGEAKVGDKWVPLGTLLRNSASDYGLRSGDVNGFYKGQPDPNHVDDGYNVGGVKKIPPPPATAPPPPVVNPNDVGTGTPPGVTPPNYMPPPVEPPMAASPPPELPGSQSYSLHNDGYQSSWQAVSQMPDLHPDTQRLLALSGVTNGG